MGVHDESLVVVLLADYVGIDAGGKINALGAGFTITLPLANGQTAPQHVVALVDVPGKYAGQQFAFSIELRDESTGQAVQVPTGPGGQLDALRVQQVADVVKPPVPPGYATPPDVICRVQVALGFQGGLPLQPGRTYRWQVQIDGKDKPGALARFHVLGPAPGPVFGGPAGPAHIPPLPQP